jgi:hypothetical protein
MITKRIAVGVLGVILCSVVLWWGTAEGANVSSLSAGPIGSLSLGVSGSPAPAQSPWSSPHGQSQGRTASEAAGGERPRVQKPQRLSLGGDGSGQRRFKGRGGRRTGRRRGGSGRAGRKPVSEKRLMKFLKRQVEVPSHVPRKKRIAKKRANASSSGNRVTSALSTFN